MNLRFKLGRSVYLAVLLFLSHGAFLAALPQLALPVWSMLALAMAVLLNLAYFLWRDALLAAPSSCAELVIVGGGVMLVLRNGKRLSGRISGSSLVTPWLTVVNVSLSQRHKVRSVLILPDSMAKDEFRQLRVWLKWGGQDAG
jgi:toxin CptA